MHSAATAIHYYVVGDLSGCIYSVSVLPALNSLRPSEVILIMILIIRRVTTAPLISHLPANCSLIHKL